MEQYWKKLAYQRRELADCESEPIQFCGAIQSCGWMIITDKASEEIIAASENLSQLFKVPLGEILGKKTADFLDHSNVTRSELRTFTVKATGQKLEGSWSSSKTYSILDLEPAIAYHERSPIEFVDQLRRLVYQVDAEFEIEPMLALAVKQLRALTSFDRVMIYRFEANWDGHVIAEAADETLEPMFGMYYPASDIPPQARKLYYDSRYRMIVDVKEEPVPVQTRVGLGRSELDLGSSFLRAVSPFHIQYLRNMGVRSSF